MGGVDMMHELLTWRQRGMLWFRMIIRLVLLILAWGLLRRFGSEIVSLFAPFLFALIVAMILNPAVQWLQRGLGWSRQFSSLLILILLFGLVGTGLFYLFYAAGREVVDLAQNWNKLFPAVQSAMEQLDSLFYHFLSILPTELTAMVQDGIQALLAWLNETIPGVMTKVIQTMGGKFANMPAFLVAVLMFLLGIYFLTADYPYLRTKVIQLMDEDLLRFLGQVRTTALGAFGGYLKAQILLSTGVFFIILAGFTLTGQSYGLLLALGLSILDFIPLVGAGTVMIPWAVIMLILDDYETATVLFVIWGIISIFRRFAEPKFVGDQTGLSPILSLISIYVGMKLFGVFGMVFGPIFVLVTINLVGMGIFKGVYSDVQGMIRDISAILSQRIEDT